MLGKLSLRLSRTGAESTYSELLQPSFCQTPSGIQFTDVRGTTDTGIVILMSPECMSVQPRKADMVWVLDMTIHNVYSAIQCSLSVLRNPPKTWKLIFEKRNKIIWE
uniref:Uncharacterized protein n=1 Tax=Cacopsylla melanoneura TaxID=428564 RepID=A0A8D8V4J2_9HEMI